jgi:hypothetical protein
LCWSEAGVGTVSSALAMGAAGAVIALGPGEVLTPAVGERAVCLIGSATPLDDGESCDAGADEARLPLTLVQDTGGDTSRELEWEEDLLQRMRQMLLDNMTEFEARRRGSPVTPEIRDELREALEERIGAVIDYTEEECMDRFQLDAAGCAQHNARRRQVWERQHRRPRSQ